LGRKKTAAAEKNWNYLSRLITRKVLPLVTFFQQQVKPNF